MDSVENEQMELPLEDMNLGPELVIALTEAQEEFPPIPETEYNPFFKSSYAPLKEINKAVDHILRKHGLTVLQRPTVIHGVFETQALETILIHRSGQYIRGIQLLQPVKSDPQGMGSAMSYARRYSKSAILGLTTEPDDDANTASQTGQRQKPKPTPKQRQTQQAQQIAKDALKETAANLNKEIHKLGGLVKKDHSALSQMAHNLFEVESMSDLTTKQQRLMLIDLYVEHLGMADSVLTWWKKGAPKKDSPGPQDVSENQQIAALKKLRKLSLEREEEAA